MVNELIIGVDLGLTNPHRVALVDFATSREVGKSFHFDRDIDGLHKLMDRIDKVKGDRELVFVMEPTSMAWLPVACFVIGKGHRVYTVQPKKVAALRKFLGLDKSDRIDCVTLTKVYQVKPDMLNQLFLPPANVKTLDRFCRQQARLVKQTSAIRGRIWHIFTFANPKALDILGGLNFSAQCRAFLRHFVDAQQVVDAGLEKFTQFLAEHTHGELDPELPQKLMQASLSAVEMYKDYKKQHGLPYDAEGLQMEVDIEMNVLEAIEKELQTVKKEIARRYRLVDPQRHLESFRGIGPAIAPAIHGAVGNVQRFPNQRAYKGFLSMVSKKDQSADHDRKGKRIKKASFWLLKRDFYLAADVARQWDPEIAEFYHRLMKRGKHHNQAICACANKLAGRVYAVLRRMADPDCPPEKVPYQLRDLQGKPVDKKTAKAIIVANFSDSAGKVQPQAQPAPEPDLAALMKRLQKRNSDKAAHDVKSMTLVLQEILQTALANLEKNKNQNNSESEVVKEQKLST